MGKVFIFDYNRCNGCRNCQLACKDEHVDNVWAPYAQAQPDTGQFWLKLEEKVRGQVPKVKVSYSVRMCQHCDNAPCMAAAAAAGRPDAVYKREDGLVIVDPEKAQGMPELVEACPYGAIYYNEELGLAQKCTGCAHLVDAGEIPHCVDVCPHEALRFGDEEDFAEEIAQAKLFDEDRADDKPRMYYLNKPLRFLAGVVVDLEADEVVIGAKVTIENVETGEVMATETDEFGNFWFHQIAAGNWRVYFEAEGFLSRMLETSTELEDRNMGPVELFTFDM